MSCCIFFIDDALVALMVLGAPRRKASCSSMFGFISPSAFLYEVGSRSKPLGSNRKSSDTYKSSNSWYVFSISLVTLFSSSSISTSNTLFNSAAQAGAAVLCTYGVKSLVVHSPCTSKSLKALYSIFVGTSMFFVLPTSVRVAVSRVTFTSANSFLPLLNLKVSSFFSAS